MASGQENPVQTRTRSPHHRVVYCNQVGSTSTSTDVRLRFGVIEFQDNKDQRVEDQVDVVMGPHMVAQLRDLLDRVVKKHFIEEPAELVGNAEAKTG